MSNKDLTLAEIYQQLNRHDVSDAREALRAESEYEHNIEDAQGKEIATVMIWWDGSLFYTDNASSEAWLHWEDFTAHLKSEIEHMQGYYLPRIDHLFPWLEDAFLGFNLYYIYGRNAEDQPFTMEYFGNGNTEGFESYEQAEKVAEAQMQIFEDEWTEDEEFSGEYEIRCERRL